MGWGREPRNMRRSLGLLLVASLLPVSADAAPDTPVLSGNVTLIGNIPELGAVGGHVRTVNTLLGPKTYFMMSGASGVSAYDITVPEAPVLAGRLVLPHWSNEDVEVGGDLMLVGNDPKWMDITRATGPEALGGLYILDISQLPLITFAYRNPATGNRWVDPVTGYAGHTTTCIRTDCSYAILNGAGEVTVVDLRDASVPRIVTRFESVVGSTHDAQMDASGIVWISGSGGVVGYSFEDPADPEVVVPRSAGGLDYQHNAWRPRAAEWTPGGTGTEVRVGELLMVTEETMFPLNSLSPQCLDQGRFQTRRMRDADAIGSGSAAAVTILDTWQTELNLRGAASTSSVCSAHYFSERDGIVAIAWYQQGVRFLDVSNPRDIRQIGYYLNPATAVFAAEWIGDATDAVGGEIVYTVDPARGLDILRFDRSATTTVAAPVVDAPAATLLAPSDDWGYACSLVI